MESSKLPQPEIEVEPEVSEGRRKYPFTPARLFAYTRTLEARVEELEGKLEEAEAYIKHLANMGLAMRGIPPPRQQRRPDSPSSSVQKRPVTMAAIRAQHKKKFRERYETQNSSSQQEEARVISGSDQVDIQTQINAVVQHRGENK